MDIPKRYPKSILLFALWFAVLFGGFVKLFIYSNSPGEAARAPASWVKNSQLGFDHVKPTLVVFVHPHCPCSAATVGELERLMPHVKDKAKTLVVFFRPKGEKEDWVEGKLWRQTRAIPGVEIVSDEDGREAALFDAKTSGQTFLYDEKGKLVFNGGLTNERGHMGDSLGRDDILNYFAGKKSDKDSSTSVFGCSLRAPERAVASEAKTGTKK